MPSTSHTASEYSLLAKSLLGLNSSVANLLSLYNNIYSDPILRDALQGLDDVSAVAPVTGPALMTLLGNFNLAAPGALADVIYRAQQAYASASDPGELVPRQLSVGPFVFFDSYSSSYSPCAPASFYAPSDAFELPASALPGTFVPCYFSPPATPSSPTSSHNLDLAIESGTSEYVLSVQTLHPSVIGQIYLKDNPSSTVSSSDYSYDASTGTLTFSTLPAPGDYVVACSFDSQFSPTFLGLFYGEQASSFPSLPSTYTFLPESSATQSASGTLLFQFTMPLHAVSVLPVFTLSFFSS